MFFLLTIKTYNIYLYIYIYIFIFNYINIILSVYQQYQIIDTETIIYVNIIDSLNVLNINIKL